MKMIASITDSMDFTKAPSMDLEASSDEEAKLQEDMLKEGHQGAAALAQVS